MPIEIEHFLTLAALVVAIGLVVRVRDLRSGHAEDPGPDDASSMPMRARLADTGFLPPSEWKARATLRAPARRRPGTVSASSGTDVGAADR